MSFTLYMEIKDEAPAGIMMIGVRDIRFDKPPLPGDGR